MNAKELKMKLYEVGIKQNYLARNLGVSQSYISHILAGKRKIFPELEQKLGEILGSDWKRDKAEVEKDVMRYAFLKTLISDLDNLVDCAMGGNGTSVSELLLDALLEREEDGNKGREDTNRI